MTWQFGAGLAALIFFTSIYFAFLALRHARTPQGSAAWVVFLLSAPYLAVPSFLFIGSFKLLGYMTGRRDNPAVSRGLKAYSERYAPRQDENEQLYAALEKIAAIPVGRGSDMDLLIDGAATFDAIFTAIAQAQSYVLVQSYIIRDDGVGRRLRDALLERVSAGVKVRLIYDAVGCVGLPKSYLETLRTGGVEVFNAHARGGPRSRLQVNFRNHRKTVVVDGAVGFTGGLNMADEYLGLSPRFGPWRDTHARLTGPIVLQLQLVFCEDWHWATGTEISAELDWAVREAPADKDAVLVATGPADAFDTGSFYFCTLINNARERLWIATPYFVPELDILTALKLAAMRGVEVRVLTPKTADHTIPWLAALAYFDEIMEAGVEVWRYTEGFMHQKVVLVDDRIVSVGTTNLDNRSCRLNFEETAVVFDRDSAADAARMLEADFARAVRLDKRLDDRRGRERWLAPVARLFSPLL